MPDYLSLVASEGPSVATGEASKPANPYQDMLVEEERNRTAMMSATVTGAVGTNPDEYNKQKKVADYLGYPPAAVAALPEDSKRQAQVKQVQDATANNPTLRAAYSDEDFAKLAHDDAPTLASIGDHIVEAAKYVFSANRSGPGFIKDFLGGAYYGGNKGMAGVGQAASELGAKALEGLFPEFRIYEENYVGVGNPLRRLAEGFATQSQAAGEHLKKVSPPQPGVIAGGVSSGVQSLGQNLMMMPLALMTGGESVALTSMASVQGGDSYAKARAAGVSEHAALIYGLSDAVIEYATEKLPLHALVDSVKKGAGFLKTAAATALPDLIGEQIATAGQDLNEWAVMPENKNKPFSEYLKERPAAAVQTLIATLIGIGGHAGVMHSIQTAVDNANGQQRQVDEADAGAENLKAMFQLATQSKLRERQPALFAQYVQNKAESTENAATHVYVDARTLAGEGGLLNQEKVAEVLPSVAPQLAEALATGGDVQIPIGELMANVAGTPLEQKLLEHLRTTPDGLSQAEAKEAGDMAAEFMQKQAEQVIAGAKDQTEMAASIDAVKTAVLDQLNTANRFTPDVHQAYASLIGDFYAVTSARLGISPEEMFQRYPLRVAAVNPAAQGDLAQPAFHGTPHTVDRFTTQKIGTGEGAQAYGWGMYFAGHEKVAKFYRDSLAGPGQGKLYKVEVPEDDKLLDWNKSVAEQPEGVKAALEKLGVQMETHEVLGADGTILAIRDTAEAARRFITQNNVAGKVRTRPSEASGANAYEALSKKLGGDEAASKALLAAGIQGSRHLDQLSRRKPVAEQTHNYVVFDDQHVGQPEQVYNQPVYHGSPHNFEAFSLDHIGTGEGAQAYGWGLYFAENRTVASGYFTALADQPGITEMKLGSMRLNERNSFDYSRRATESDVENVRASLAEDLLINTSDLHAAGREGFRDHVLKLLDDRIANYYDPATDANMIQAAKTLRTMLAAPGALSIGFHPVQGGVYSAHVPDEAIEKMLHWDKPFAEQSKHVKQALKDSGVYKAYRENLSDFATPQETRGSVPRGQYIYQFLAHTHGGQEGASKFLASIGIPGLKYLDGGSRDTKKGTHNIVLWDQKVIDELNREVKKALYQGPRGTFNPSTLSISLLEGADLSTFLHETGHFFLEVTADIASQPNAPADVQSDMAELLKWFGVADLAAWNGMSLEQKRPLHEKFAESFEQYLFEGKAPSQSLQPLFQRFRAWMTSVYRSISQFMSSHNTMLTEEVRHVFNRMLASEEAIKQAEAAREFAPIFKSAEEAGMDPVAWLAYQAQGQAATDKAIGDLQTRSLRDMRFAANARSKALKELQRGAESKRKAIKAEVTAEVAQDPVYAVQHFVAQKENANLPEELLAEMFGFTSADHMKEAVNAAGPEDARIEGMTEQRLLERYGDLTTPQGIARAADEAVHNEVRARFVATELRAMMEAGKQGEKTARGGSVNVIVRAAKEFASGLIARRKVRDLKPGQHLQAETRAGRNAEKALAAGKTQEAIVAKRDQLLNHYAARMTNEALAEVEKRVAWLRKFNDAKNTLPPEYLDQIQKLLERFDLRKTTNTALDKRKSLVDWVESQRAIGVEPELPDGLLNEAQRQNYRDMTVEEFRGLVDTVKQIEHLGRLKGKLLTAKDKRDFEEVRDTIVASIVEHAGDRKADTRTPTTNTGRVWNAMKAFGAAHIKAATWARVFDGGKDGGPFWNYIIRPANAAGNYETTERAKATKALTEILAPVFKAGSLGGKGKFFPSVGRSFNRESLLSIALNTGNDGNLQRLLGGEGWTMQQLQPLLDSLSKDDWTTVQNIWAHFETYKPLIGAKQMRVYGTEPNWITPTERQQVLPDGTTMTVAGGYYPIKYDPAASVRAEEHADAEGAKRQLQGAYGAATTRRSFTKTRAEEVTGRPLLYTLGGVYSGVNDVIHDLAWHEWLIDANRLLRSQAIDSAMREHYGPHAVRQIKSWRDAVAEGESGPQEALDMALGKLRQGVSIAGLGFNVMSALLQPLGMTQSIVRIGPQAAGRGIVKYIANPRRATREVHEQSEFMRSRTRTRFRELNELKNRVQGQTKARESLQTGAYYLMMQLQQTVDVPTWLGAQEKAILEGATDERAVELADQAVIDAQGGGQTKDQSAIERGGPAQKLFTVFYSFMNTAANLGYASRNTNQGKAKIAADALLIYVIPALLGAALKDALTPGDSGDWSDWRKIVRKLLGEQLAFLLGTLVVGREVGDLAKSISGGKTPHDYTGPAGVRMIGDVTTLAKQVQQGELDDQFRKALINLVGDMAGLPSAQINRTITGAKAIKDKKTVNPAALVLGYQEPHK